MENQRDSGVRLSDLLHRVYLELKRSWLIIVSVVLLSVAGGAIYSTLKPPIYTATEYCIYKATINKEEASYYDYTATNSYLATVLDFCNEGCVVDRANFYYDRFMNGSFENVDAFNRAVAQAELEKAGELYYTPEKRVNKSYISAGNITIVNGGEGFKILVSYKDKDPDVIYNKLKILCTAINNEAVATNPDGTNKYFGVELFLQDWGFSGMDYDYSIKRTIAVAFLVGLAISIVLVYIRSLFNRTIKDTKELISLIGVDVLAQIDYDRE